MKPPIEFPSEMEVISEEAARFRALSPEERVKALGEAFRLYQFLTRSSPRSKELAEFAEAEEALGRRAIEEFVRRHGQR